MRFFSSVNRELASRKFRDVAIDVQVAWMASLGISKKGFWARNALLLISLPLSLVFGYGETGQAVYAAGTASYSHFASNLVAAMLWQMHWMGWLYPGVLAFYVAMVVLTRMWSNEFWLRVQALQSE